MSSQEPHNWYVYQPFPPGTPRGMRIYGVGAPSIRAIEVTIQGLTRDEAEAVCAALREESPSGFLTPKRTWDGLAQPKGDKP
jgi:hypothetical protein